MEEKINIVDILKDKPQGTKLYSRICGAVELKKVIDIHKKKSIVVKELNSNNQHRFWYDGKFFRTGQCVLQPSEDMADWSKFAWKKGDVLVSEDRTAHLIFEKFTDETYTTFIGMYHYANNDYYVSECDSAITDLYTLETENSALTYINTIEERLGGKLNLETLEIEKSQLEFKDGNIIYAESNAYHYPSIHILNINGDTKRYYARLVINDRYNESIDYNIPAFDDENPNRLRLATEEEKQLLFNALANEGKAWDAEKKAILDLKPKVEFKPFDKVLCRNSKDDTWEVDFFARLTRKEIDYTQSGKYLCVGDLWMYCIPYNEETAHLLGTTDEWKGGEQ